MGMGPIHDAEVVQASRESPLLNAIEELHRCISMMEEAINVTGAQLGPVRRDRPTPEDSRAQVRLGESRAVGLVQEASGRVLRLRDDLTAIMESVEV